MINNIDGLDDMDKLTFNHSFIKEQNIQSIEVISQIKKELAPIKKLPNLKTYYAFSPNGNLNYYYRIYAITPSFLDTIVEFYSYENHLLSECIKTEYGYFGMYEYIYQDNKVIQQKHYRVENETEDKLMFSPKNKVLQSEEKYSYETMSKSSYLKCTKSQDDVCYKTEEFYFENELPSLYISRYIFDDRKQKKVIFTQKNNAIVEKNKYNTFTNTLEERITYTYDTKNNLTAIYAFNPESGIKTYTVEFLYKNNILDAILKKEERTGTIEIRKYRYTYY